MTAFGSERAFPSDGDYNIWIRPQSKIDALDKAPSCLIDSELIMGRSAKKFDRWGLWAGKTLAFRRFIKHHTELNEMYWAYQPVSSANQYIVRKLKCNDPTKYPTVLPEEFFHARGDSDARHLAFTMTEWEKNFEDYENWMRCSLLMSASAYLEMYLKDMAILALASDPLRSIGLSRKVDGIKLIKDGIKTPNIDYINGCTRGVWMDRIANMKIIFGSVPELFEEKREELDEFRVFRNRVGHNFGRRDHERVSFEDTLTRCIESDGTHDRFSKERLLKWLALVDKVASAAEDAWGHPVIGEFEVLFAYRQFKAINRFNSVDTRDLSRYLYHIFGKVPGKTFSNEVISYYERL